MLKRHEQEQKPKADAVRKVSEARTEFDRAVRVFLRPPQSKLIRHICGNLAVDATYVLRNRRSIEQVMRGIMKMQGIKVTEALHGSSCIEILRVSATKLNITIEEERWKMY